MVHRNIRPDEQYARQSSQNELGRASFHTTQYDFFMTKIYKSLKSQKKWGRDVAQYSELKQGAPVTPKKDRFSGLAKFRRPYCRLVSR
jgi:hypothetical protein